MDHSARLTMFLARCLVILLFASLVLPPVIPAQAQSETVIFTLLPSSLRPGGYTLVQGQVSDYSHTYHIEASCISDLTRGVSYDRKGEFSITVQIIPKTPAPSICIFYLKDDLNAVHAQVNLKVLAGISLSLDDTNAPPGTIIHFTVANLATASSLRLDYAGVPVFGPVPTGGAAFPFPAQPVSYSGTFTVPKDRPDPLGSLTQVTAVNLSANSILGEVSVSFTSQVPPAPYQYAFQNIQGNAPRIAASETFTITGRLVPPPNVNTHIGLMYSDTPTRTVPLAANVTILNGQGDFRLVSHLPDLLAGDASMPTSGHAQVMVTAFSNSHDGRAITVDLGLTLAPPPLTIKAVAAQSGQPIEGAIISLIPAPYLDKTDPSGEMVLNTHNQVADYSQALGFDQMRNQIYPHCGDHFFGMTDQYGQEVNDVDDLKELISDPNALLQSIYEKVIGNYKDSYHVPGWTTTPMHANAAVGNQPQTTGYTPKRYEGMLAVGDAVGLGYGLVDELKGPIPYYVVIYYDTQTRTWLDANQVAIPGNVLTLSESLLPAQFRSYTLYDTITHDQPIYGFAGLSEAGVALAMDTDLRLIDVKLEINDWVATNRVAKITLYPPAGSPSDLTYAGKSQCEDIYGMGAYSGSFFVHMLDLTPGQPISFKVILYPKSGNPVEFNYSVATIPLPSWIYDSTITNRSVRRYYWPYGFLFTGKRGDSSQNAQSISGYIPHYQDDDTIDNSVSFDNDLYWFYSDFGDVENGTNQGINSTVLDQPSSMVLANESWIQSTTLTRQGPEAPGTVQYDYCPAPGVDAIQFDSGGRQSLFDSGRIDLAAFTVPTALGNVNASVGFWYGAGLTYAGYNQIDPPYSCVETTPDSYVGMDFDAHVNFLGFVATGGATFWAGNNEMLTTVFENGNPSPFFSWGYRGDLNVYWGVLCVCGHCLYKSNNSSTLYCNNFNCGQSIFSSSEKDASTLAGSQPTDQGSHTVPGMPSNVTPPEDVHVLLATDGRGQVMQLAGATANSLKARLYDGITWGMTSTVTTGNYPIDASLAYYDTNKAVALWTESTLPQGTPIVTPDDVDTAIRSYHLDYSLWNGSAWSARQDLTTATTGDAQTALAACRNHDPNCPDGGAVTAVWTHDTVGSFAQRKYQLMTSRFDPATQTWGSIGPVDPNQPPFPIADTNPVVIYAKRLSTDSSNLPFVAWVRDDDGSYNTLSDRHIATRWLGFCGLQVCPAVTLTDLPAGIMQISLATAPDGSVRMAFTRAEQGASAFSTRHTLYTAEQTCGGLLGACTWKVQQVQDSHGRSIYAEDPILTLDSNGHGTITFRGLGFASSTAGSSYPEDALGMTTLRGELAQAETDFSSSIVGLHYLTNDGAVNWNPASLYLPQYSQTLSLAIRGTQTGLSQDLIQAVQPEGARVSASAPAEGATGMVAFAALPRQPDFDLIDLKLTPALPQQHGPLSLEVGIRNNGLSWTASGTPAVVVATWDGVYSVGPLAGTATFSSLSAGQTLTVTLSLDTNLNFDVPHTLSVTINPTQTVGEISQGNNERTMNVAEMPVVTGVTAMARPGNPYIQVSWDETADARKVGYRVYRSDDGGPYLPVGSSFVNGFVDLNANLGHNYRYAVTFYSYYGLESPVSASYPVTAKFIRVYLPVVRNR